jgi:hypothetical protein
MSYLALWLDLAMGCVDYLYNRVYDAIYTTEQDKQAPPTSEEDADGGLPELQQSRSTVTDQED